MPDGQSTLAESGLGDRDSSASVADALPPGMRLWFAFFLLWMAAWAGAALYALHLFDASGNGWAFRAWILALACFYLSLCNAFLPFPTTWIVMLAASDHAGLVANPWGRVLTVSGLAAAATVVANLNEYHLLTYLLHFGWGRRVRRTRVYAWAVRWFDRAPLQLLALIAFIPLPIDAVRWLAILRGYSRIRFAAAYFLGRWPRYVVLAGGSVVLSLSTAQVLLVQAGLVVAAVVVRLVVHAVRRARAPTTAELS